jgi:hypothetical protein
MGGGGSTAARTARIAIDGCQPFDRGRYRADALTQPPIGWTCPMIAAFFARCRVDQFCADLGDTPVKGEVIANPPTGHYQGEPYHPAHGGIFTARHFFPIW